MTSPEEEQLLTQGVEDYVHALDAISAFRSLVQRKCRRVVQDHLKEYAAALGIELTQGSLKEYEWSDGKQHSVGVAVRDQGAVYASLSHGLYWAPGEEGHCERGLATSIWSRTKNLERLREILRAKAVAFEGETGDELWLSEQISTTDVDQFDSKLDALMEGWIALWRKAGGLKALAGK